MQLPRRTQASVSEEAAGPSRVAGPSLWNRLQGRLATPVDDLAWIVVAGGAVLLAAAFIWLAPPLSHLYPSPIHDEFALWRTAITPEPLEETRAVLALGMPLLLAATLLAFGTPKSAQARLDALVVPLQIAGFALLVVAVLRQPQTGPFLSADYFSKDLLSVTNLIAGAIIGLLLTAIAIRPPSPGWIASRRRTVARVGGWRWLAVAVAVAATTIWLLPAVITTDTLPRAGAVDVGPHSRSRGGLLRRGERANAARRLHRAVLESSAVRARAGAEGGRTIDHLVVDQHVRAVGARDGCDLRRFRAGNSERLDRARPVRALGCAESFSVA